MNSTILERRLSSLRSAVEPIISFLDDDNILEIMLNEDGCVWVDVVGKGMHCTSVKVTPDSAERMIRLVSASMNFEINENNPSLAAKLPGWGARVQAMMPPIVEAPTFSLRKPAKVVYTLYEYVENGILSEDQARFIISCVKQRKNILIGGGTGSGKTTLTNAVLLVIAETEDRLYIVEDNPELQCLAKNKVKILTRPPVYDCRRAIMDALRMRPDRIIVGEVRDGSALDLLKAWNTGHPGGIATIHADNPRSMLNRLCSLIEEVVPKAPRDLVAEAVDICIHITASPAGRKLSGIVQVDGLDSSGDWKITSPL